MSRKTNPFPSYVGENVGRGKKDKIFSGPCRTRDDLSTKSTTEKDKLCTLYNKKPKQSKAKSACTGQNKAPSDNSFKMKPKGSWSQLLKNRNEPSTFSKFDPLRTLHFLIKELECRIKTDIPDVHLQQIVHDMLSALNRVPPEVASTIHLHQKLEKEEQVIENSKRYQEKEIKTFKTLVHKGAQTPRSLFVDDTELFRKEVEASTTKLEESCKQMEIFCEKIKIEKQELEQKFRIEKETVKALKRRVQELEEDKTRKEALIEQLSREKDALKSQLATAFSKTQHREPPAHVKTIIKELTAQKLEAEKDCVTLRHQLAVSDLEKEKYITLLAVRERQCKEIRDETQQLQEVIKKQLSELGTNNSEPNRQGVENSFALSSIRSLLPEEQQKRPHLLASFAELQSGDSSAVDVENKKLDSSNDHIPSRDILLKASEGMLMANISNSSNIPETLKQVFEELKREAYSITANLYDRS